MTKRPAMTKESPMNRWLLVLGLLALAGVATFSYAQEGSAGSPAAPGFGGPLAIDAQLQRDSAPVEPFFRKLSLMAWHTDEYADNKGEGPVSPEAQGLVGTAYWTIDDTYIPVLLAGIADGAGANTLAEKHLAAMFGIEFKSHDVWSFGLNWIEPPDSSLRDQYTFETYYRFHVTEHLALTPDFQAVYHPSLNEAQDWLYYGGVRARLTF